MEKVLDAVCCCEQGCVYLPYTDYTALEATCVTMLNGTLVLGKNCGDNPCSKVFDAVCCCEQGCMDLQWSDYTQLEATCVTMLNGTLVLDKKCSEVSCTGGVVSGGCEVVSGGCGA